MKSNLKEKSIISNSTGTGCKKGGCSPNIQKIENKFIREEITNNIIEEEFAPARAEDIFPTV